VKECPRLVEVNSSRSAVALADRRGNDRRGGAVTNVPTEPDELVIVTGSVVARPETLDEMVTRSLEHVRRSRSERGCISHAVHRDVEDPNRLVFVERWVDWASLAEHFNVRASVDFVRTVERLAAEPPVIAIYLARRSR
jgi:quinol monooxygenase YgiN